MSYLHCAEDGIAWLKITLFSIDHMLHEKGSRDVNCQTLLAEAMGRLKAAKEELEVPPSSVHHNGKLYLTEEACDARWKQREAKKPSVGGRGGGFR
jgi:hypothetical protein